MRVVRSSSDLPVRNGQELTRRRGSLALPCSCLHRLARSVRRRVRRRGSWCGSTADVAHDDRADPCARADAVTGIRRQLAISPAPPIGLSVTGQRVAWAVNRHGHGSVLALTLR